MMQPIGMQLSATQCGLGGGCLPRSVRVLPLRRPQAPRMPHRCRSSPEEDAPAGPAVSVSDPTPASSTSSSSAATTAASAGSSSEEGIANPRRAKRQADSTDAVASFLSRRFGLAGGLAWLAVLAVGSLGEQVKTRLEVAAEQNGTQDVSDAQEVATPSGLRYQDLRVGGGQAPIPGYLVVLHYVAKANGEVFDDTKARGKPIVFIYGSRPFTAALCPGVEEAVRSMRAGGRRTVKIPAALGFGDRGAVLRPTEHVPDKQGVVPPGADLEYDLELLRVSIPPS